VTSVFLLLGAGAPIALGLGWCTWRRRSFPGARPFALLICLAGLWGFGSTFELLAGSLQAKLLWCDLQQMAISFLPVLLLTMILDYTGHDHWIRVRRLLPLCVVPVITATLIWTNDYHHLMRVSAWLVPTGSYSVVGESYGLAFWLQAAYSYALVAVAVALLVNSILSVPALHRRQPIAVLVGVCLPLVPHFVHLSAPGALSTPNLTTAVLGLAGLLIAWGLFRFRLFSLVPVARHAILDVMDDCVLVLDQADRVVDLNSSAQTLIGRPVSSILGQPLANCWSAWEQMAAPCAAGASQAELYLGEGSGQRHYEVKWSSLTRHDQVLGRLVVLRDATHRILMEENLRRQALTDGLTGLPNRALFMARLDDAIHQARRHEDALFAVMVLDLDRFKLINDSIGHLAGDVLLQSVATKLKRCVREADTVARMGGDEFMILLPMITGARDLLPVLDRIQEELRTPVFFRQQEMTAASSVGVVIWDPSYDNPEDVLRAADTAMYQAKEAGRGCHRIFDEEMHRSVLATLNAETDLRAAIRQRDFSLAYQPLIDLKTGTVSSLEALMRWHHTSRGTVYPDEFIAVAESSGLIVELGEMALEEVCGQISRWQSPGNPAASIPISLNLSPRQLIEPEFVAMVVNRLAEWRIPSDHLMLEITENALIRDPLKARQVMHELKSLGIRLCLDDFGTGWSSLQHLTSFPVQELKIDRAFVSKIVRSNTDSEVVRLLTALAHTLGLKVTAEGVEHGEQLQLLQELGCDCVQGYFISMPLEPEELLSYLQDMSRGSCPLPRQARPDSLQQAPGETVPRRDSAVDLWYHPLPLCNDQP
jgi:diguanylate cyclase (GGDEF)-like protein